MQVFQEKSGANQLKNLWKMLIYLKQGYQKYSKINIQKIKKCLKEREVHNIKR